MPFANLSLGEKEAFFGLLDEYFQSRPEIFGQAQQGGGGVAASAINAFPVRDGTPASAIKHAMASNPEATAKVFSAGLRHAANAASPPPPPARGSPARSNTSNEDEPPTSVAGRIAAFRNSSSGPQKLTTPTGLTSSKKFGNLDTSSTGMFVSSLVSSKAPPAHAAPPVKPILPKSNNRFAPPPTRRVSTAAAVEQEEEEVPPPPGRKPFAQKEEPRGEWAEALYDYESSEAGDLNIREGQQVLVTERSSDDWWTGEVNGKSGLFPAAYVKTL